MKTEIKESVFWKCYACAVCILLVVTYLIVPAI